MRRVCAVNSPLEILSARVTKNIRPRATFVFIPLCGGSFFFCASQNLMVIVAML